MSTQFPSPEEITKPESIISDEEQEFSEIRKITLGDTGEFHIISPQETDSSGADAWKTYLDRKKLLDAWSPPQLSPYRRFIKTRTVNSVEFVGSKIKPRYSDGEIKSERELYNLISSGQLEKGTAVILDSGGAHSVAMAVKLAEHGFQPIIMFDSVLHSKGMNRSEQELATLLYFAEQMNRLKQEGRIKPDAPPVFILDTHRDDTFGQDKTRINNTYTYSENDFPSSEEFQKLGVQKIIYLNEGNQKGKIRPDFQSPNRLMKDLKPIVEKWTQAGIKIAYTGISPWKKTMVNEIGSEITRYKESVKDTVSEWKLLIDTLQNSGNSLFSMFWVAGPDDKTKSAIDYIAQQLGIDRSAVIEFEIDPKQWDVTRNLEQFADKVRSMNGNRVLIIARGFEKVLANTIEDYRLSRAGHDWDQDVLERPEKTGWGKLYSGMNKHVVIITTIGLSAGQEAYDKTVKSALISQHKTGIMLLN